MRSHSLRFRMTLWYAGLLGLCVTLAGIAVYVGLATYMERSLRNSLREESRGIAENFLTLWKQRGEPFALSELNDYGADIRSRYLRVSRPDGTVLYLSRPPQDAGFNPGEVPMWKTALAPGTRESTTVFAPQRVVLERLGYDAGGGHVYVIEAGASYQGIALVLHGLLLIFLVGMPVVLAVTVAGGYVIMRQGLAPVREITEHAKRISSRNFSERLPVQETGDELESLALSLNGMIERLEGAFEHIRRFSADVAHELRPPLAILRGELEGVARQRQLSPDLLETIGSTLEEVDRLTRIVEHLLIISRLDAGEALITARVNLGEIISSTVEQMKLLAEEKAIVVRQSISKDVEVDGDPLRLGQVVVNLLDNAIKYTPEGGTVEVTVEKNSEQAVISIADTGIGIPANALPHIFERFYRADRARARDSGGAGLGLSIVKAICSAHSGEVSVESSESLGTRVTIALPLARRDPTPANGATRQTAGAARSS